MSLLSDLLKQKPNDRPRSAFKAKALQQAMDQQQIIQHLGLIAFGDGDDKTRLAALKLLGTHQAMWADLPSLIAGLKSYGIDLQRVDGRYVVVGDDSDPLQ